ncbi:hypothetical protein HDV00_002083 [Rhizophlyctis rosea]|nr:hypothetical protein HDV00_002083 [Rhizophlyctis rosea]
MENDEIAQALIGRTITGKNEGDLVLTRVLGSGSFAVVYQAEAVNSTRRYAVKCLFKYGLSKTQLKLQRKEAEILELIRGHRNIINLYDTIDTEDCLFLVMDLCDGDLFDAIERRGGFADSTVRDVFAQLSDALAHVHSRGVYHRDIKPENVLVVYEDIGDDEERIIVKLTDFGLATTDSWSTEFGCGSVRYMAPECLGDDDKDDNKNGEDEEEGYAPGPNDVWALGVLLVNMLTGQNPWVEPSMSDPLYAAYKGAEGDILKVHFGFSDELNEILARVFDVEAHRRPSLGELKDMVVEVERFFDVSGFDQASTEEEYVSHSTTPLPIPIPVAATDSAIAVTPVRNAPIADRKVTMTKSHASWSSDMSEMNFDEVPVFDDLPARPTPQVVVKPTAETVEPRPTVPVVVASAPSSPSVQPSARPNIAGKPTVAVATTPANTASNTSTPNIATRRGRNNRRPRNNRRRAPQQGPRHPVNYCAAPPTSPVVTRRQQGNQQNCAQGIIQCAVMRLNGLVGGRVCVVG